MSVLIVVLREDLQISVLVVEHRSIHQLRLKFFIQKWEVFPFLIYELQSCVAIVKIALMYHRRDAEDNSVPLRAA